MKTPYSRHDFLLQHYQRWLDDFTRLAVRHGLCHPNIQASHQLTIGSLRFTGTGQVHCRGTPCFVPVVLR